VQTDCSKCSTVSWVKQIPSISLTGNILHDNVGRGDLATRQLQYRRVVPLGERPPESRLKACASWYGRGAFSARDLQQEGHAK
jgi:hypothetical protein